MIDDFVQLIRRYLALTDGLPAPNAKDFLSHCAIVLPQIYSLAHQLPGVELPEDEPVEIDLEKIKPELGGIESPMGRIMKVLGECDPYYEVFDPVKEKDAISPRLSDELSDVYLDLKRPLLKYDSGDETNRRLAIWDRNLPSKSTGATIWWMPCVRYTGCCMSSSARKTRIKRPPLSRQAAPI